MSDQSYDITLYEKNACVQCDATKRMLNRLGLHFWTVNIEEDPEAYARAKSWGFQQAPVLEVYDKVDKAVIRWSGFRPDRIKALAQ